MSCGLSLVGGARPDGLAASFLSYVFNQGAAFWEKYCRCRLLCVFVWNFVNLQENSQCDGVEECSKDYIARTHVAPFAVVSCLCAAVAVAKGGICVIDADSQGDKC